MHAIPGERVNVLERDRSHGAPLCHAFDESRERFFPMRSGILKLASMEPVDHQDKRPLWRRLRMLGPSVGDTVTTASRFRDGRSGRGGKVLAGLLQCRDALFYPSCIRSVDDPYHGISLLQIPTPKKTERGVPAEVQEHPSNLRTVGRTRDREAVESHGRNIALSLAIN